MARKIDQMPDSYRARYPWDEWFDGSVWELAQGEDFKVAPVSMGAIASQAAARRGIRAAVHVHGTRVYIQASPDGKAHGDVPDGD